MCVTNSVTSSLYLDMNEKLPQLTIEEEKELAKLHKALDSEDSENMEKVLKSYKYDTEYAGERYSELRKKEEESHNYVFIGKVGQFCPIKQGCNGGLLMREKDGKYYAAGGSKGYRWLEAEMVKELGKEADIDRSYYENMVNDAICDISQYGDFEWFVN